MAKKPTYEKLEQSLEELKKENDKLKGVEKELESVYRRLTSHLENTPLGVIEWGKGFRFLGWSPVAEDIFGWIADEVLDKTLDDFKFIHDEDRQSVNDAMTRLFSLQEPHNIVLNRNYRKDGKVVHCEWYNSVLYDQEGNMESVLSLVQNITERRQAEVALRESEEFTATLLNRSPISVLVLNPDNSIRYVNPALENLTGFSHAELIGKLPPYPWWSEETMQKIRNDFEKGRQEGLQKVDEVFQKKSGEKFWVEITSKPVRKNGELNYYLVNWVEITDRQQAMDDLHKANEELDRFSRELEKRVQEKTKKLEEKNKQLVEAERLAALGKMADRVAHSLRNPLAIIGGFARRMDRKTDDDDPNKEYLGIMIKEVENLEKKVFQIIGLKETEE